MAGEACPCEPMRRERPWDRHFLRCNWKCWRFPRVFNRRSIRRVMLSEAKHPALCGTARCFGVPQHDIYATGDASPAKALEPPGQLADVGAGDFVLLGDEQPAVELGVVVVQDVLDAGGDGKVVLGPP